MYTEKCSSFAIVAANWLLMIYLGYNYTDKWCNGFDGDDDFPKLQSKLFSLL